MDRPLLLLAILSHFCWYKKRRSRQRHVASRPSRDIDRVSCLFDRTAYPMCGTALVFGVGEEPGAILIRTREKAQTGKLIPVIRWVAGGLLLPLLGPGR